ncbi:DUF3224 domain-containing protein [Pedococcus sp. KACC 23699]|uniref:DUF3224 domain-containing protein n=1 Tax=Pedococcus sp. KACC 23699 TaxID=3149228 RepID=A0AAU7JT21_9MICO
MRTEGTFTVESFTPAELSPAPEVVVTSAPVGVAVMLKQYTGGVSGRSTTIFTAAYDQARGAGTYVAMESFDGALDGAAGTFNFVHSATTEGGGRTHEHFAVVPGSGTAELAGIRGGGGLAVEDDGTHRVWFDYQLG